MSLKSAQTLIHLFLFEALALLCSVLANHLVLSLLQLLQQQLQQVVPTAAWEEVLTARSVP